MTGQPFNLDSLTELVRKIREEQAANPERTRLENLIASKFTFTLETFPAARMLAEAILADGFHRPEAPEGEGIWTMTDTEFARARKEERIAELRETVDDKETPPLVRAWCGARARVLEGEL